MPLQSQQTFSPRNLKIIDYKDTELLKKFLTPHGRISSRPYTGLSATMQRELARAVKRARYMGLLPYVTR
ncbi:MAG: 30S ribosomal protein S18 [bacterium]|nr:30S ribosomal protein S18 [bacterium]MDZ4284292.1 30S ribosomal protein S18 [Patescibacteria group bacterium]